jgi:Bacterial cell division membrane protein
LRPKLIFLSALLLSFLGILHLFPKTDLVIKQSFYLLLSLSAFLWISRINIRSILENSHLLFFITILLLIAVFFLDRGAIRRWINLGFFNLQPSEFAKATVPIYLLSLNGDFKKILVGFITTLLILMEPDLATSTVILLTSWVVIFITTENLPLVIYLTSLPLGAILSFSKSLFAVFLWLFSFSMALLRVKLEWMIPSIISVLLIGLSAPLIWEKGLREYQRKRILALIKPEEHSEKVWQIYQSRVALANSGILGKGIRGATQKNYGFLPAWHTDFAFSSLVETYGYLAGFFAIGLSAILTFGILSLAFSEDKLLSQVSLTYSSLLAYQTLANLMSVMGVLPTAGIPYPFLSFGGSHLFSEWLILSFIFSAYRYRIS